MKKLTALLLAVVLLVVVCCSCAAGGDRVPEDNSQIDKIEHSLIQLLGASGAENIVVYDRSELTADILENRRGTTVVERCIGVVTNAEKGDGAVLNTADTDNNYIGFHSVSWPLDNGTVLLSYMVYNPCNNNAEDIVERYDFVLNIEWERLSEICMNSGV